MASKWPRNPAQWQEAVNLAQALLLIDSARCYGLITGGPEVVLWRCDVILSRGAKRGVYPQERAVTRIALTIATGGANDG